MKRRNFVALGTASLASIPFLGKASIQQMNVDPAMDVPTVYITASTLFRHTFTLS